MSRQLLICTAIGAVLGAWSSAYAQPALEEVIVTAQKTEESIQDVPIVIQALDAGTLEKNSINNFADIKALVPSLKVIQNPTTQENLLFSIRGITSSAVELTQDNPTAIHINGVYIARGNGLNMAVADLERIEVLKGPQGTLYGRNATAGAINLITAKPTGQFGIKQQLTVAEYDQFISKTSINFPITDTLAGKVSYLYDTKDGFVDNIAPNSIDFGERTAQAARVDLLWTPIADLIVEYGFDWSQSKYFSTPGQCMERGTGATFGTLVDPNECSTSFKDKLAFYGDHPRNKVSAFGHTLSVEWDLGEVTLRSITGYREFDDQYHGILFGGGPDITGGVVDYYAPGISLPAQPNKTLGDQFSQEIQLLGDIGDTMSYSTGLYYFKETGSEFKGRSASIIQHMAPGVTMVRLNGERDVKAENSSWAVFGQLTWSPEVFDGNLDIIPGIRYTEDSREASMFEMRNGCYFGGAYTESASLGCALSFTGLADGTPASYDNDFSEVSPSLTLQYHFSDEVMGYAKAVKGYKAGGTAIRSTKNEAFSNGFDPETLVSYELGVKSSLLDRRLRLNASVFQSEYDDQQVTVRDATSTLPQYDIQNAGESTYQGFELEMVMAITEQLRATVNYTALHFEYDKVSAFDAASQSEVDVTDFYHNIVADKAWSASLDYSLPLGFAVLDANLTYSYVDAQGVPFQDTYNFVNGQAVLLAAADERQFVTPDYGVWNGRVALSDIGVGAGSLTVALWAKNLLDKEYVSYAFSTVPNAEQYQAFWGEPRTFGLDVIYRYE